MKETKIQHRPVYDSLSCPYCQSTDFVRRGFREKKLEKIQLYLCRKCRRTFTQHGVKGKHYPLKVIFEAVSLYNTGYSFEESCRIVNSQSTDGKINLNASTLSTWLEEFSEYVKFLRMRPYAIKKYNPQNIVESATLAHRQLYRFKFHRAKCRLAIEDDYKHRNFKPLEEFLSLVSSETPHQYFQEGLRASEAPIKFSKTEMIIRGKRNFANKICGFVLQGVKDRKNRHNTLQEFMIYNDSVTVATEVPVYITNDDLAHLQTKLGFELYDRSFKKYESVNDLPRLITGHIDVLQIRNGQIHILDYKPNAEKNKPVEQLTIYALALSRLTGLKVYEFKCAWFDEKDYFEFYPLHVLYKPPKVKRRKKVYTDDGTYEVNKIKEKIQVEKPRDTL